MGKGSNTIYYWSGLIGEQSLINDYAHVLQKIMAGEYKEADLKKLSGHNVYSARVNDTHRLLFTTIRVQGESYLLFLEEILNHDYQKSRFLKPEVLKQYLDKNKEAYREVAVKKEDFNSLSSNVDLPQSQISSPPTYHSASYYNQQFIVLNTEQNAVLAAKMPLVVSGGPGSGKSCVAMSLLRQHAESHRDKKEKILYVTRSERLVDTMSAMWDEIGDPAARSDVLFKSYNELLPELNANSRKKNLADRDYFVQWFQSSPKGKKSIGLSKEQESISAEKVYQEFRIISGYDDKSSYLDLGKRQSIFHDKKLKDVLYLSYQAYQVHLEAQNKLDPGFYLPNIAELEYYRMIVVDEAQDLSPGQLRLLESLALDGQICYCIDTHQSLMDNQSKRPFLLQMKGMSQIKLPFSYRCPLHVRAMADAVLDLKIRLTGGLSDKDERSGMEPSSHTDEKKGVVRWFSTLSAEEKKSLAQKGQSVDFAVITQPRFVQEARDLFKTGLVFTPEEIKGLEYPVVLAFRLFDDEQFYKANQKLQPAFKQKTTSKIHRPKAGEGDFDFAPPFNEVYTSLTRAMQELIIVQRAEHKLKHILTELKSRLPKASPKADFVEEQTSSKNDWLQAIEKLIRNGNLRQAKDLFEQHIAGSKADDFENWVKMKKLTPSAQDISKIFPKQEALAQKPEKVKKSIQQPVSSLPEQSDKRPVTESTLIKLDKQLNYISGLLKEFNPNNLKRLFEHKKCLTFLFQIPIPDKNKKERERALIELICCSEPYAKVFNRFLRDHPELARKIDAHILCQTYPDAFIYPAKNVKENFGASVLHWLCLSPDGCEILFTLLEINPSLIAGITAEALCRPVQLEGADTNALFPLFYLSSMHEGAKVLTFILKYKPSIALQVPGDLFCQPVSDVNSGMTGLNLLVSFCMAESGLDCLSKLIDLNPPLAKDLSRNVLCNPITRKNIEGQTSLLYLLSLGIKGHRVLEKLLENNQELAENVTESGLFEYLSSGLFIKEPSAFYFLTTTSVGIRVLTLLFRFKRDLIKQVTATTLIHAPVPKRNKPGDLIVPLSALEMLVIDKAGKRLLEVFVQYDASLISKLLEVGLSMPKDIEELDTQTLNQRAAIVEAIKVFVPDCLRNLKSPPRTTQTQSVISSVQSFFSSPLNQVLDSFFNPPGPPNP